MGGATAGEHLHSRTEELFFVLSGNATNTLGSVEHEVGPRDMVLTGFMGVQAVENRRGEPYRMLVIELAPPEVLERLTDHSPSVEAA